MKSKTALACLFLLGTSASLADPIPVTYEIGDYSTSGYSASWLHEATGCADTGPSGDTLYMCGDRYDISGTINGVLDNGIFTVLGGEVFVDGTRHGVRDGVLGSFDDLAAQDSWNLRIRGLGRFFFEPLAMGPGSPNFFDGDTMILWGQNGSSYRCDPSDSCDGRDRWGIDLYATRVSVSEPATLALFGIGLMATALLRRRRTTFSK